MVKTFAPDWVVPPGEILREHLAEVGRSQADLARSVGWSQKFVCELVNGKASLTIDTAMLLEDETGIGARFWLHMEADYQIGLHRAVDGV